MPSVSKKQQKFMGIVRSIQKGEQPASKFSKDAQDAAKSMKKGSVKKYAKTKHDDLPTKKIKEGAYKSATKNELAQYIINLNNMLAVAKSKKMTNHIKFIQQDIKDVKKALSKKKNESVNEAMSASQIKKMRDDFKKTGELPPHLKTLVKGKKEFEKKFKVKDIVIPGMEWMSKLGEERDYKDEYKKFQSSTKSKKYRAELNKYNRKKGTYGNGDGKDASHKGGKIVGFEKESKNRGRAEKSRLKKENNIPDFNPIIDEVLDEVFGEYQMNENSKVIKSIENLATKNKYGDVTGTKMNGKTANLIMKIYNHPKMKKYQKAMEKYTSDELVDMTLKMPKVLGIKENVDEAKYKGYDYKRQNRKDGLSLIVPALRKTFANMKDLKKYIDKHGKMESVNEGKLSEDYKNSEWEVYVADENGKEKIMKKAKSKRAGVILYNKLINSDKYHEVGMRVVKESVNEGQKKQASMILRKYDLAFLKFSREIRDVIKMVDRSTGSKVDGKIIEKAYEKGLIPLNKIMIEWDRGQQENPGLSEDD